MYHMETNKKLVEIVSSWQEFDFSGLMFYSICSISVSCFQLFVITKINSTP